MSDALSLIRNFVKNKKEFHEEDDKIIFGDVFYYKNVKTSYLIYGTGKEDRPKDYYNLECLAFLIKNRDLQHSMYVKSAGTRNISVVLRPDRRELLSYLDGEIETSSSIDKYAPIEIAMQRPQPYIKNSASNLAMAYGNKRSALANEEDMSEQSGSSKQAKTAEYQLEMSSMNGSNASNEQNAANNSLNQQMTNASQTTKELFIERLSQKFDSSQSSRPITENIMPLSEQLSIEKIVSIKLKKKAQQRTKVSSGVEMDDDILISNNNNASSSQTQSLSKKANDENSRILNSSKYNYDYNVGSSSGFITGIGVAGADDSDAIMREIVQRERVCRNRFTVLQSTGKQFDKDISAFLQSIKAKEEGTDLNNSSMLNNSQMQMNNTSALSNIQANSSQKSRSLGYNRFDQERYSAKDETGGFSIDTKLTYQPNGGTISLTPNTNTGSTSNNGSSSSSLSALEKTANLNKPQSYFHSSQINQNKPNLPVNISQSTNSLNKSKYTSSNMPQKRSHSNPIIIIPATRTSLIQMINALDILQELKFVSTEDKKKNA